MWGGGDGVRIGLEEENPPLSYPHQSVSLRVHGVGEDPPKRSVEQLDVFPAMGVEVIEGSCSGLDILSTLAPECVQGDGVTIVH